MILGKDQNLAERQVKTADLIIPNSRIKKEGGQLNEKVSR